MAKRHFNIVQTFVLQATGFLVSNDDQISTTITGPTPSKFSRKSLILGLKTTIALGTLVGTWTFACLKLTKTCYNVATNTTISSIINILYGLPGVALAWRAAFVLHIMFIKRKSVWLLLNDIVAFAYFSPELVLHFFPKIRKLSVFLLVASFILQMSWPITQLLYDIEAAGFNTTTEFMWATANQSFFFFETLNWQYYCMDVILRHLPFVLAQQIIIMVSMSCIVLAEILKRFVREVTEAGVDQQIDFAALTKKLTAWRDFYENVRGFSRKIEAHFGLVIFVAYCGDFMVVLGATSWFLTPLVGVQSYMATCCPLLAFGSSATFLAITLINVHEKVSRTFSPTRTFSDLFLIHWFCREKNHLKPCVTWGTSSNEILLPRWALCVWKKKYFDVESENMSSRILPSLPEYSFCPGFRVTITLTQRSRSEIWRILNDPARIIPFASAALVCFTSRGRLWLV